jgi:hypothetical protein
VKRHVKLYAFGTVLERSEHGDNGEIIDGNDGIGPVLHSHPCSAEPRAHNDVHDARVPVLQVTFDDRESHLGVVSLDDSFVDVGQSISRWRILVDTPSRD